MIFIANEKYISPPHSTLRTRQTTTNFTTQFISVPVALCSTKKSFPFSFLIKILCFLNTENYKTRRKVTFSILFAHLPPYVHIFLSLPCSQKFSFSLLALYSDTAGLELFYIIIIIIIIINSGP